MGKMKQAIGRVFQGGAKAFSRFPAAMVSAVLIAVSATILIESDNTALERILRNLQLSCLLGAFLGLALAVLALTRRYRPLLFAGANILALLAAGGVFWLLQQQPATIPELITARLIAGAAISFLVFLLVVARDADRCDYNQASFMVLKSALIALIYGLVIMLGFFFVAFTVKSLLYSDLREEVYQHIAVWSALGWFAFFLGYFPSFRRDRADDHLATAQKHPAFIEILFAYVMVPIMSILTLVLLIWAIQTLIVGNWRDFGQMAAIFSAYALFGIFLSLMISHYVQPLARFFRRVFPFAAILFLAFEAYAIYRQIGLHGLKTSEYFFSLIWIYALLSAVCLIVLPVRRNSLTAWAAMLLIAAAVLPMTGYQDLPVAAQTSRLRQVLSKNDMLADNKIQLAPASIAAEDKMAITDATYFLLGYPAAVKAGWFTASISRSLDFQKVYGFDPVYATGETTHPTEQYTNLYRPSGVLDIAAYQFIGFKDQGSSDQMTTITGQTGTYKVSLAGIGYNGTPRLVVTLNGAAFLEQDLTPWLETLNQKYHGATGKESGNAAFEDMLLKLDHDGRQLLVVFESVEISESGNPQVKTYYLSISGVFLKEN